MTRENKLALIVGFGLVLFVGILVSDHLSTARREAAASLQVRHGGQPARPVNLDNGWLVYGSTVDQHSHQNTDTPTPHDQSLPSERIPVADTASHSPHYAVTSGDTLQNICQRHYGTPQLATALARYNRLPDPDRLTLSTRLLLPPADVLLADESGDSAIASMTTSDVVPASTGSLGEYEVQSGDTLSELAQKLLGSSRDTDRLFEMNQDVLRSKDDLRVGIALKYPLTP